MKLLVLGGSGLIGNALLKNSKNELDILTTFYKNPISIKKVGEKTRMSLRPERIILNPGENFHVYRGLRHQMVALEDSHLFEFSTQHFDSDSYRIIRGD